MTKKKKKPAAPKTIYIARSEYDGRYTLVAFTSRKEAKDCLAEDADGGILAEYQLVDTKKISYQIIEE